MEEIALPKLSPFQYFLMCLGAGLVSYSCVVLLIELLTPSPKPFLHHLSMDDFNAIAAARHKKATEPLTVNRDEFRRPEPDTVRETSNDG